MLAIGHMAVGIAGALLILLYFPSWIPNFIRNDVFFILGSGFWSMMPDIALVFQNVNSKALHQWWGNIFWLHPYIDSFTKDTPATAAVFIGIAGILLYLYYKKIGGL